MSTENKSEFKRVAVLAHSSRPEADEEAAKVADFLSEHGLQVEHGQLLDDDLRQKVRDGEFDLVVTLGGDGAMLRAGHLTAPRDIPVLGIHMGRFGFLIEIEPDRWPEMLPQLLAGDYWFEQRMMLEVGLWRNDKEVDSWQALNEAMIGRGKVVRPVHLEASLDGHTLTTYVADGLIIATATGSTAYALAAGGPILPPSLRNILLVPVAPHLSVDRAIVLAEGAAIEIKLQRGEGAVLSIDGQQGIDLQEGDRVRAAASQHSVRFLRFQESGYFYRRLLSIMDNNPSASMD